MALGAERLGVRGDGRGDGGGDGVALGAFLREDLAHEDVRLVLLVAHRVQVASERGLVLGHAVGHRRELAAESALERLHGLLRVRLPRVRLLRVGTAELGEERLVVRDRAGGRRLARRPRADGRARGATRGGIRDAGRGRRGARARAREVGPPTRGETSKHRGGANNTVSPRGRSQQHPRVRRDE